MISYTCHVKFGSLCLVLFTFTRKPDTAYTNFMVSGRISTFKRSDGILPPMDSSSHSERPAPGSTAVYDGPSTSMDPLFSNPLEDWIMSHSCWKSMPSRSTTQDQRGTAGNHIEPEMPEDRSRLLFTPDAAFVQCIGSFADLAERVECQMCTNIYLHIKRILTVPGVEVECNVDCTITSMAEDRWCFTAHVR